MTQYGILVQLKDGTWTIKVRSTVSRRIIKRILRDNYSNTGYTRKNACIRHFRRLYPDVPLINDDHQDKYIGNTMIGKYLDVNDISIPV